MPLVPSSTYLPPWWLPGGHAQTVHPVVCRRVSQISGDDAELGLPDGDVFAVRWHRRGNARLAILTHGLEGSYDAGYIRGMTAACLASGWDVLSWNLRGCGAAANRLPRFYHSGATDDLDRIVCHGYESHPARQLALIGFSLGGNLVLKFLGEGKFASAERVSGAVAFSVPCDLRECATKLEQGANRVYAERFLITLRKKIVERKQQFPEAFGDLPMDQIRTIASFDENVTAPLNGFRSALDYWQRSSCRQFLSDIRVPTLLVNAANDPLLGPQCFPREEAAASKHFTLEIPNQGGHCGFGHQRGNYWSEQRAVEFLGNLPS